MFRSIGSIDCIFAANNKKCAHPDKKVWWWNLNCVLYDDFVAACRKQIKKDCFCPPVKTPKA